MMKSTENQSPEAPGTPKSNKSYFRDPPETPPEHPGPPQIEDTTFRALPHSAKGGQKESSRSVPDVPRSLPEGSGNDPGTKKESTWSVCAVKQLLFPFSNVCRSVFDCFLQVATLVSCGQCHTKPIFHFFAQVVKTVSKSGAQTSEN